MSSKIPFLWTNDDISAGWPPGGSHALQRQLDFLARFDLKGTFFVIPRHWNNQEKRGVPLTDDPELIELLKSAMENGHEAHQHSTTHACIENGTADLRMFDLMGDESKAEYSYHRFAYERIWQLDAIEAQIGWGRQVWTDVFGAPSEGFRPGCGAFCGNMYLALENLGFKWTSGRCASMTGWMWQNGRYDYPLRLEGPVRPFRQGDVMEIPMLDDVAFKVSQERIEQFVELGWDLWRACYERGLPYVLLSHPQGLDFEGGTGYAVHEKLLPRILESGQADQMTMNEYSRRVETGEFPLADDQDVYPGAHEIPEWHILAQRTAKI